jgi:thymidylate synthase ThyX
MTQTPQVLTASLGYAVPRIITAAGFEVDYRKAMDKAKVTYEQLADWNPQVAAYIVPNGFNRRMLMTLNLREAYHFCSLRSAENAHFSVRRIALRMAEQIRTHHPSLAAYIHLPTDVTWKTIENQFFSQA